MTHPYAIHRRLGWGLLLTGAALGCWLDPQVAHRPTSGSVLAGVHGREVQLVLFEMGLLQLMFAELAGASARFRYGSVSSWLLIAGSVSYAAGWLFPAVGSWLAAAGMLANAAGLVLLLTGCRGWEAKVLLAISVGGIVLDALLTAAELVPEPPLHLGPSDGLALRLLRLARMAAAALPLLTLHYRALLLRTPAHSRVFRWAGWALLVGSAGMPICLTAAALARPELKYLLPLPADAVFLGAWAGAWLACRSQGSASRWPWLLVAASITAGMLMGGYSFNGPLPAPPGMAAYQDLARQCVRLAHTYALVFALAGQALEFQAPGPRWEFRGWLLPAGVALTVGLLLVRIAVPLPPPLLALGPAAVAVAFFLSMLVNKVPVSLGPGADNGR